MKNKIVTRKKMFFFTQYMIIHFNSIKGDTIYWAWNRSDASWLSSAEAYYISQGTNYITIDA